MKLKIFTAVLLALVLCFSGCIGSNHGQSNTDSGLTDAPSSSEPIPTEVESTEDVPTGDPIFSAKGVLSSKESETLILYAKWEAVSYNGKTADVTVKVGITCYSISTGKHTGSVTVNGEEKEFSTRAIESKTHEKKKFEFATFTFRVELDEDGQTLLDIEAIWDFNDTEGGVEIEQLVASAIIKLPGGEVYLPDTSERSTEEGEPLEAAYVGEEYPLGDI